MRSQDLLSIAFALIAVGVLIAATYLAIGFLPLDVFVPLANPVRLEQFDDPALLLRRVRAGIQNGLAAAMLVSAFAALVWLVRCALFKPSTPHEARGIKVWWWVLAAIALVVSFAAAAAVLHQARSTFFTESLWLSSVAIAVVAVFLAYWLVGTVRFTPRLSRHAVPLG